MSDTHVFGKVRNPSTKDIIEQAGGVFNGFWNTPNGLLIMFEDAEQKPPRSTLVYKYNEVHLSQDPVSVVRAHIERSRKAFREAKQ